MKDISISKLHAKFEHNRTNGYDVINVSFLDFVEPEQPHISFVSYLHISHQKVFVFHLSFLKLSIIEIISFRIESCQSMLEAMIECGGKDSKQRKLCACMAM